MITVSPKRGLTAIEDEKLREKLEAYKKSLGAEEIQAIVDGTKELKEYQDTRPEGRFREDSAVETLRYPQRGGEIYPDRARDWRNQGAGT